MKFEFIAAFKTLKKHYVRRVKVTALYSMLIPSYRIALLSCFCFVYVNPFRYVLLELIYISLVVTVVIFVVNNYSIHSILEGGP